MGNQIGGCQICQNENKLDLCSFCTRKVCERCFDYPLIRMSEQIQKLSDVQYLPACKQCFRKNTELDFTTNYQIIGKQNKRQIIFLHGAGSTRAMFRPHAKALAQKGYKSILIDLPGHGARMDQSLTIQNCQNAILQAVKLCNSEKITIIGGSLGGYILMEVLGRNNKLCESAVVMMCGQDVGVNRGKKASIGLWMMGKATNLMSQVSIAKNFLKAAGANKNLNEKMVVELLKSGTYFKHSQENIHLLKNGRYEKSLKSTENKIKFLFVNGQEDYRDSEQIWLSAVNKESKLIVYEKTDHFFSHDQRYFDRLVQDIDNFLS